MHEGKLCFGAFVLTIQLQRLVIGETRHLGVDVTETLVCGGVAGMGIDCEQQRIPRLHIFATRSVEHRQIVVWLGQVGIFRRELGKHLYRRVGTILLREDDALEKSPLSMSRVAREKTVGGIERLIVIAPGDLRPYLVEIFVLRAGGYRAQGKQKTQGQSEGREMHRQSYVYPIETGNGF